MIAALAFVAAAATGAVARAEIGRRLNQPEGLAIGTLVVNVTGSFLLGLLWDIAPPALTVLGMGGLGAFTTFSGFARDAAALITMKRLGLAALYVALSCGLAIGAAAAGVALAGG